MQLPGCITSFCAGVNNPPFISVVIPVYNGGATFRRCLEAVFSTAYAQWECIVVDDGSTDGSGQVAAQYGARVVSSEHPKSGPAVCRNLGAAQAQGDLLFFVDADVLININTLSQVAAIMADEAVAACFGSYDASPTETNFLSQYRNLQHHYVHQISNLEATTFWGACGAVRRAVFEEMGGFNTAVFTRPSIEDIELGYRIRAAGYYIRLEKTLQVRHMKRWTAVSVLLTDIRDRAIPWSKLILQTGAVLNDLNLQTSQRLSALAVFGGLLGLAIAFWFPPAWLLVMACAAMLGYLNGRFYAFLYRQRGLLFLLMSLPWHWLYFLYSTLAFGWCYVNKLLAISSRFSG